MAALYTIITCRCKYKHKWRCILPDDLKMPQCPSCKTPAKEIAFLKFEGPLAAEVNEKLHPPTDYPKEAIK